jgi:tetratricopeptide (TPR) repeat protein
VSSQRRLFAFGSVVVFFTAWLSWFSPGDADTLWHLRTGALILEAGWPRVDPFSFVLDGRPWVAFEWLAQILFWLSFKAFGPVGLVAFKTALCAAAFAFAFASAKDRPALSAAAAVLAAFGARGFLVARPYAFDHMLFAGLLFALRGVDFTERPGRAGWALAVLTALWANLHGGAALLAPISLAVAVAAEGVSGRKVDWKGWGGAAAFSCAAVLFNPYGWGVLGHLWGTVTFPAKELLYEWRPPASELRGVYGVFLAASLASAVWLRRRNPRSAAWVAMTAVASFGMQRSIPLLLLAGIPAVAEAAGALAARFERVLPKFSDSAAIALLLGCGVLGFRLHTAFVFPHRSFSAVPVLRVPLEGAAAFLAREGIRGRGFNEYEAGGALIYRTGPERKVFVDGRSLEYGADFLRAALAWYRSETWSALDAEWNFDYAIVRRHPSGAYTARVFDADPAWGLAFWDDEAMVYLKRDGANGDVLVRREFKLLQPGRSNHQYVAALVSEPGGVDRVLAELDRALADDPSIANALQLKTFVLAGAGRLGPALATARRAVEAHPGRAQAHFLHGWVLESGGDPGAAEAAYREALSRVGRRSRPTVGADILNNLGRLREKAGDRSGALLLYKRALEWNPRQGHALRNLQRLRS